MRTFNIILYVLVSLLSLSAWIFIGNKVKELDHRVKVQEDRWSVSVKDGVYYNSFGQVTEWLPPELTTAELIEQYIKSVDEKLDLLSETIGYKYYPAKTTSLSAVYLRRK